jgi:hypothetical protein
MASTIYNNITGQISMVMGLDNVPANDVTSSIPGFYPPEGFYVDIVTKQPVAIPLPPQDGNSYTWNPVTKTWDLNS